jgi:hypothetical protein
VKTKRTVKDRELEDTDTTGICEKRGASQSAVEIEKIDHVAVRFDTRK